MSMPALGEMNDIAPGWFSQILMHQYLSISLHNKSRDLG